MTCSCAPSRGGSHSGAHTAERMLAPMMLLRPRSEMSSAMFGTRSASRCCTTRFAIARLTLAMGWPVRLRDARTTDSPPSSIMTIAERCTGMASKMTSSTCSKISGKVF